MGYCANVECVNFAWGRACDSCGKNFCHACEKFAHSCGKELLAERAWGSIIISSVISPDSNPSTLVCAHCPCKILLAGVATRATTEISLHPIFRVGEAQEASVVETLSDYWLVDDQMKFENIGVTREVPGGAQATTARPFKYLICADCDRGPVGITYLDNPTHFYIARARVKEL